MDFIVIPSEYPYFFVNVANLIYVQECGTKWCDAQYSLIAQIKNVKRIS